MFHGPATVLIEPWRCYVRWPPDCVGLGWVIHEYRERTYPILLVRLDAGGYAQVDERCVSAADNILAFRKPVKIKEPVL